MVGNYSYYDLVKTNSDYKKLEYFLYEENNNESKILEFIRSIFEYDYLCMKEMSNNDVYYWALNEGYKKETNGDIYIHKLKK